MRPEVKDGFDNSNDVLRNGIKLVTDVCNTFQLVRSEKTTREAVLDPMRMIRAASVWEAWRTV